MSKQRTYRITTRPTEPIFDRDTGRHYGWSTSYGILHELDGVQHREVKYSSFDGLDGAIAASAAEHPAAHVDVTVRVADGGRKPAGFDKRYGHLEPYSKVPIVPTTAEVQP